MFSLDELPEDQSTVIRVFETPEGIIVGFRVPEGLPFCIRFSGQYLTYDSLPQYRIVKLNFAMLRYLGWHEGDHLCWNITQYGCTNFFKRT